MSLEQAPSALQPDQQLTHQAVLEGYLQASQGPPNEDLVAHMRRLAANEQLPAEQVTAAQFVEDAAERASQGPGDSSEYHKRHEISQRHHQEHIDRAEAVIPGVAELLVPQQDVVGEMMEIGLTATIDAGVEVVPDEIVTDDWYSGFDFGKSELATGEEADLDTKPEPVVETISPVELLKKRCELSDEVMALRRNGEGAKALAAAKETARPEDILLLESSAKLADTLGDKPGFQGNPDMLVEYDEDLRATPSTVALHKSTVGYLERALVTESKWHKAIEGQVAPINETVIFLDTEGEHLGKPAPESDYRLALEVADALLVRQDAHYKVHSEVWGERVEAIIMSDEQVDQMVSDRDSIGLFGMIATETNRFYLSNLGQDVDPQAVLDRAGQAAASVPEEGLRQLAYMHVLDGYLDPKIGDLTKAEALVDSGVFSEAMTIYGQKALEQRKLEVTAGISHHVMLAEQLTVLSEHHFNKTVAPELAKLSPEEAHRLMTVPLESLPEIELSINMSTASIMSMLYSDGRVKTYHDSTDGFGGNATTSGGEYWAYHEYRESRDAFEDLAGMTARGTSYDQHPVSTAVASGTAEAIVGAASTLSRYGDAAIFLRPEKTVDSTVYTWGDSFNVNKGKQAGFPELPKFLNTADARRAKAVLDGLRAAGHGYDGEKGVPYIEGQRLGGVEVDDISRVVLPHDFDDSQLAELTANFPAIEFSRRPTSQELEAAYPQLQLTKLASS